MLVTILGLTAGTLTTFSFIPQLLQVIKSKHTKDLSLKMYMILILGVVLWFIYGFFMKDPAVMIANAVTFIIAAAIISYKIKYG